MKEGINDLSRWEEFAKQSFMHKQKLIQMLEDAKNTGGVVIGYGASARSSTMLNFCNIGPKHLLGIADQNRLKQGLYTAGTHIPIVSPEEALQKNPTHILLLGWNFATEIIDILKKKFNYQGTCIIPLPHDPRLERIQ